VDAALIASAALLGLAGAPHCALMCSAPCAAAIGQGGRPAGIAFHLARMGGYAAAGALMAASVGALASWSQFSPALRPLWTLLHAAALVLGAMLLWRGRQPAWMAAWGRSPQPAADAGWQTVRAPLRAAALGGMWVGWPCGLLQSALLVAAMTGGALTGAAAMAGFALASSPGLLLGPWAWRRLLGRGDPQARERWATRAAGALLLLASGWALGHGLWPQVAAYCGLA
jgi:sulfite exporter TauE/SafE